MSYTVYKHTSPSGKVYIGITQQRPSKRFQRGGGYKHCPHMREAVKKYGWDAFRHEILETGLTRTDAEIEEVTYIAVFKSTNPQYGYNISSGGGTTQMSEEGKERLRARMTGDNNPARKYGSPMLGKKHTDEAKKKMSASASKRHVPCSESRRLAIREGHAFEKKPVVCVETGVVYNGIHEAAEANGLQATKICSVCKGRRHTTGNLHWRYADEETT